MNSRCKQVVVKEFGGSFWMLSMGTPSPPVLNKKALIFQGFFVFWFCWYAIEYAIGCWLCLVLIGRDWITAVYSVIWNVQIGIACA